ncbi:sporulation protein SsgA [Streptomyces sp. NBC_01102]|uniref:plasmid transfer protein TraA n=1 Tax=Streptomyces sp. NBC_01102 TaxID=2903749 RepID=UPI003869386B|nr:sporulation protein SsgA [Streptomyces sp. NBC_01102]
MAQQQTNGFFHNSNPGAEEPSFPRSQQARAAGHEQPKGAPKGAPTYNFHFGPKDGGQQQAGSRGANGSRIGQQQGQAGGRRSSTYSPLSDPEFFTNDDVRNYCEAARAAFIQLSFDISMAAEILNAVLKEVPDPDGRAFGSRMRARRVTRRLSKVADDAKDAAKNAAATYAAFQREFSPEMQHNPRARQQPGRRFDFNA